MAGFSGAMPLPAGEPVYIKKPSPSERAVLEKIGWKDGEPIPSQLADAIVEMKAQTMDENLPPPVRLTDQPAVLPKVQLLEELPAEKQAEYTELLANMMQQAKQQAAEETERRKAYDEIAVPGAGPGINEAIMKGHSVSGLQIVDDRVPKKAEAAVPEKKAVDAPAPGQCSHCGWPYSDKSTVEPSDADKDSFVQSILGGKAFQKAYKFYNDKLVFILRTLAPREIDAVYAAVRQDMQNDAVTTFLEAREMRARYLSIAMLSRVQRGEQVFDCEAVTAATLSERMQKLIDTVLPSEILLRHLVSASADFRQLVDKLEVNAANPDFY